MGLPCISTDCAGADEMIKNEENGILVHVGDENGLAAAIKKVLGSVFLRNKIAENAKNNSKVFAKNVVLKKWQSTIGE
jgi:glycosyltransferase involved in cell wall biosynthesis